MCKTKSDKRASTSKSPGKFDATIALWKKAFTAKSEWPDKDEFLDVIYWLRQILGIICGIVWGIIPLKGFLGVSLFTLLNVGGIYIYYTTFQGIDEEEFGGLWDLTKEGFSPSFAGFLVTWIIIYTGLHFD